MTRSLIATAFALVLVPVAQAQAMSPIPYVPSLWPAPGAFDDPAEPATRNATVAPRPAPSAPVQGRDR